MEALLLPPPDILVRNSDRLIDANMRALPPSLTPVKFQRSRLQCVDPHVVPDVRMAHRSAAASNLIDPYFLRGTPPFRGILPVPQAQVYTDYFPASPCQSQDSSRQQSPIQDFLSKSMKSSLSYRVQQQPPSLRCSTYSSLSTSSRTLGITSLVSFKLLPGLRDGYLAYAERRGKTDDELRLAEGRTSRCKVPESVPIRTSVSDTVVKKNRSAKSAKPKTVSPNKEVSSNCVSRRVTDDARKSTSSRTKAFSVKPDLQSTKHKKAAKKRSADDKFFDISVTLKQSNDASSTESNRYQNLQTKEILQNFSKIANVVSFHGISPPEGTESVSSTASTADDNAHPRASVKKFVLMKSAGEIRSSKEQTLIRPTFGKKHKHQFGNVACAKEQLAADEKKFPVSDFLDFEDFYDVSSPLQKQTRRHTSIFPTGRKITDDHIFRSPLYSASPYLSEHWAGPGYTISPAPSCLPIPRFPFQKEKTATNAAFKYDDVSEHAPATFPLYTLGQESRSTIDTEIATKDLRRMLHLDLS
ncbi:hypothetical protein O6H91_13G040200 [Diphasiastrum complanatum]|uniref:Uncharacterized protein n=1 Tax=Diphasiastrum complanatum TaxID=34168 RepID=A0ACC2BU37_DIPCM|nr:hypothetical protein O6H91_13G040200 [Diphasiastrum complanatum]